MDLRRLPVVADWPALNSELVVTRVSRLPFVIVGFQSAKATFIIDDATMTSICALPVGSSNYSDELAIFGPSLLPRFKLKVVEVKDGSVGRRLIDE
jgi:hypothetical protein